MITISPVAKLLYDVILEGLRICWRMILLEWLELSIPRYAGGSTRRLLSSQHDEDGLEVLICPLPPFFFL